jgi:flagellar motor switch protein FliM
LADVLSQNEIDALLNAINTGAMDVDAPPEESLHDQARLYDFRTANRFSKEQMRTLHLVYDNFARLFSTYLSGTTRSMCEVDVVGVEELKYHEFVNALPNPVLLSIISMPPLAGPTLLEMSPDVAYAIISRLLGGGSSGGGLSRSFTEIELVLLERIIRQFIGLVSEAWEKVIPVRVALERIETSAQFAQIVALGETVAIITLDVKLGDAQGLINFCLPHLAIEPIGKQLNTKVLFQSGVEMSRSMPQVAEDIRQRIRSTPLTVTAVFKDTPASVREVLSLQEGDVLRLDHRVGDALTLKVGHLSKFRATFGTQDKKYAVRILDIIREEELDHE